MNFSVSHHAAVPLSEPHTAVENMIICSTSLSLVCAVVNARPAVSEVDDRRTVNSFGEGEIGKISGDQLMHTSSALYTRINPQWLSEL